MVKSAEGSRRRDLANKIKVLTDVDRNNQVILKYQSYGGHRNLHTQGGKRTQVFTQKEQSDDYDQEVLETGM